MMASPVPRPTRFEVTRSALLARLAGALDMPVVVLAAPAGYGKTTLLAQYARSTPRTVLWCRLTEAHTSPLNVAQLVARAAAPRIGSLSTLLNPDPQMPDHQLAAQLAQAMAQASENLDLIVDHVDDPLVARWLIDLAGEFGEGHRLLLSRYSTDGLRLARQVAGGQAMILGPADLRLSSGETQVLLESRATLLSADVLAELDGWPAGLALASSGTCRQVTAQDLIHDTLALLPAEIRLPLADLAVFDTWSETEARHLRSALPPGWLAHLQQAGLPLLPLGQQQFQPHQLLLGVLMTELQRDPARAAHCAGVAAHLAEQQAEPRRAARLYALGGHHADAVRLAEPLAAHYRNRGEHHLTRELLEALPTAHLGPALQARLAWALIETGEGTQGEALLLNLHRAGQLSPAGYGSLAMVYGRRGDTELQYHYAETGRGQLAPGEVVPALCWPFVHAALKRGDPQAAQHATDEFLDWARKHGDEVRLAEAWQLQAFVARQQQALPAAQQALRKAGGVYAALGWSARAAAVRLDEAEVAVRLGNVAEAHAALTAASQHADPRNHAHHARRHVLRATVARWAGNLDEAERALSSAESHVREGALHPGQTGVNLARAEVHLARDRPEAAQQLVENDHSPGLLAEAQRTLLRALLPGGILRADRSSIEAWPDAELRRRGLALLSDTNPHLTGDARQVTAPTSAAASPQLQITALGDVMVQLNGQQVAVPLAKSRELLVWLALHGAGTRDELVTALWDGSAEERHVEYFRVAVRRLRAALRAAAPEADPLPFRDSRYRLAPELSAQLDAQPDAPMPVDIPALQAAFVSYQRPFLPGVDSEWVQDIRQRCAQRALDLGLLLAARQAPAHAHVTYRRVLQLDPWADAAHHGLIRSLLTHHLQAEAEQATRQYSQILRELGAELDAAFARELQDQGLLIR